MKLLFLTNARPQIQRPGFAKLLRIMKLTTFLLLVACLSTRANGYAQKISLSLENASVESVFKKISDQSEYYFLYTNKVVSRAKPISISVKNASIEEVLKICFEGQPLSFTIYEKTIIIKFKKPVANTDTKSDPPSPAPPIELSGTVVNDKGEPMAGVTVHVKNSGLGVMTDAKGNYHLSIPSEKAVIEFSFVGYTGKSITVSESKRWMWYFQWKRKNWMPSLW